MLTSVGFIGLLSSAVFAAAVGLIAWWVVTALSTEDMKQNEEWRYDVNRINSLRRLDPIYRLLQPLVQVLAKLNRAALAGQLAEVNRRLLAAGWPRYWLAEEYLARCDVLALLLAPLYVLLCVQVMGLEGLVTAAVLTGLTSWLLRRRLGQLGTRRLLEIKRRLPFFLDLLTLLMEAGASFLDALKQAVREFQGHPVAAEFGRVLSDMNMGKARTEAFDHLRFRLQDDEFNGIVASIIQSEQLGTPLSQIFRTQADLLRVKRSQRAETLANEAGVTMLLPAVLVMAAAVLIILGPFALNYLFFGMGI